MKRIIFSVALIFALAFVMCACSGSSDIGNSTTATTVKTTSATNEGEQSENNKSVLARIGFEEVMNYINICETYEVHIEISQDDTIGAIVNRLYDDGADFEVHNIRTDARFFDYAEKNTAAETGTVMYTVNPNSDWLSLYVE